MQFLWRTLTATWNVIHAWTDRAKELLRWNKNHFWEIFSTIRCKPYNVWMRMLGITDLSSKFSLSHWIQSIDETISLLDKATNSDFVCPKAHAQSRNVQLAFRISNHWKSRDIKVYLWIVPNFYGPKSYEPIKCEFPSALAAVAALGPVHRVYAPKRERAREKKNELTDFFKCARTNTHTMHRYIISFYKLFRTLWFQLISAPNGIYWAAIIRSRLHHFEEDPTTIPTKKKMNSSLIYI